MVPHPHALKSCLCKEEREPLGKALVAHNCLECSWWLSPEEQCGRNNKVLLNICFSLTEERFALASTWIPIQLPCACRACVCQRGRKKGKAESLEVTGLLSKEGSVISLQIVRGNCVVGVQQLLQPEGSVFPDGSCTSPSLGITSTPLLCPPAHGNRAAAEIKLSCCFTEGAVHLAGAAKEFPDHLGPNAQVSEVRVLIPKPAFP